MNELIPSVGWISALAGVLALVGGLWFARAVMTRKSWSTRDRLEDAEAKLREANEFLEQRIAERTSALEASETRFRDFARAAGDWYWETDAELRFTAVSHSSSDRTGLPAEAVLGATRAELTTDDMTSARWREHFAALRARRPFRGFTYAVRTADGRRAYSRVDGTPVFDDDGRFAGYRGLGVDMTAAVEAQHNLEAAQRRLAAAIENVQDAYAVFDEEDRLIAFNAAYVEMNRPGAGDALAPGMTFREIISAMVEHGAIESAKGREKEWLEWRMARHERPAGNFIDVPHLGDKWFQMLECRTPDGDHVLIARDVTAYKLQEQALRDSERRFRTLYDETPSMYFTVDRHGTVLSANRFGAEQLGFAPAELVGTSFEFLHLDGDAGSARENLEGCLAEPDRTHHWEIRKRRKDGAVFWVRETARVIANEAEEPVILSVCEDTSEAHALSRELTYQATHDPLTGLVNRREFERRLRRVVDTARTGDSEHAVCYLDLDQFKIINDTSGHAAGDELLRQLARVMLQRVRQRDTLSRLGGDEFGVLIEHCEIDQAARVAQDLATAVREFRFAVDDRVFVVGTSIGLVRIDASTASVSDVLAAADSACYAAKEQGRNRIHVYHPEDADLLRRRGEMQWVSRLQSAMDEDRLRLYAQPIAPLHAGSAKGAHLELLVRLEDEDGEIVLPGVFLPAAERYDLCARLDRWVVEHALEWLRGHADGLDWLDLCAINLSGQSLGDEAFMESCLELLAASDVPTHKLCFELTETSAISDLLGAQRFMQQFRERGVRFALDDFGSGLSSFGYLKSLPVDFLKIDGLFVRDICNDPVDRAMVKSISEIGRLMNMQTIAEFVESEAILAEIRKLDIDFAQGYAIGYPYPIDQARPDADRAIGAL